MFTRIISPDWEFKFFFTFLLDCDLFTATKSAPSHLAFVNFTSFLMRKAKLNEVILVQEVE